MRAELKRKTVRTVHGEKVVRLRIDVPYSVVEQHGNEDDDLGEWLDVRIGNMVNIDFSDFKDKDQMDIKDLHESI